MSTQKIQKDELLKKVKKVTLRSEETAERYVEFLEKGEKLNCIYCDRELFVKKFKHWVISENRFPYDKISELSHILYPKRHIAEEENFTDDEREELLKIKKEEMQDYDLILESTANSKSRPDHFHLHLLRYYRK